MGVMMAETVNEQDIAETETMLFTLAGQDALTEKRVILVIMESIVMLWLELKKTVSPYGNWEFTDDDRETLHNQPNEIEALLDRICQRAMPVH